MLCMLKSCTRCFGDLTAEDGYWKCVQCARYYCVESNNIVRELRAPVPAGPLFPEIESRPDLQENDLSSDLELARLFAGDPKLATRNPLRRRRNVEGGRSPRNLNSYIRAKDRGESRWWDRNRVVVEYLDRGLSVSEISQLTGQGQRQIRTIRERLSDFRAAA